MGEVLASLWRTAKEDAVSRFTEQLARVRGEIREVGSEALAELVGMPGLVVLDVRERDEFVDGHAEGCVFIPRGFLEMRVEDLISDKARPVLVYCAGGTRSALAAYTLRELGYTQVMSLVGGFGAWKAAGMPVRVPAHLTDVQRSRYSRHLRISGVGEEGQLRLLGARVLLVGVGGLGSPVALYLAAAGVGTLGLVDDDVVDRSNLQRQVIHGEANIGQLKVDSAAESIAGLNPDVRVRRHAERLTRENIDRLFGDYDIIVDGGDNFATRYLVNDAAVKHGLPVVHGSVHRFEGQVTVFWPGKGPCYRCLYPVPPAPDQAPSCQEAGVLGVVPGVIGMLQATEAVKLALGLGDVLAGRLLVWDALDGNFRELRLARDPGCPVCGPHAGEVEYVDYEAFCRA